MPPHLDSDSSAQEARPAVLAALPALHSPTSPRTLLWPLERLETPLPRSGLSGPIACAYSWEGRKGEKQALLPPPRAQAAATAPTTPVTSCDNGPGACRHRGQRGFPCRAAGEVDGQRTQRDKAAWRRGSMRRHQALWVQQALMGAAGGGWCCQLAPPWSRREHTTAFYFHDSPQVPSGQCPHQL